MKRLLVLVAVVYVGVAVGARLQERAGRLRCQCLPDCWCKRRGLSLFRWVFPYGHSLPEHASAHP